MVNITTTQYRTETDNCDINQHFKNNNSADVMYRS